jgi:enterochelin esterase-like enzyme
MVRTPCALLGGPRPYRGLNVLVMVTVLVVGSQSPTSRANASPERLLYVACGDKDGLFRISQGVHKSLDEQKVPHVYRVIPGGGHDFRVWKSDLYHFAQLVFREPGQ